MSIPAQLRRLAVTALATASLVGTTALAATPAHAETFFNNISPQNNLDLALTMTVTRSPSGKGFLVNSRTGGPTIIRAHWEARSVNVQLGGSKVAFTYVNRGGGCLDVDVESTSSGVPVVVRPCDGTQSQQWIRDFSIGGNGAFRPITNRFTGLHINVDGTSSNSAVTQRSVTQNFQVLGVASV